MNLSAPPPLPGQPVLGAGVTGLSTSVVPSSTFTLPSTGTLAAQPVLGLNTSLPTSPLTNQTALASFPLPTSTLQPSLSSAAGIRPVITALPLTSVTPGLSTASLRPLPNQAIGLPASSLPPSSMLQPTLLSPPPARGVLLQPSPAPLQTPTMPLQQTFTQAVPMQSSLQPVLVHQQPQFSPLVQQPQFSPLVQQPQLSPLVQQPQFSPLVQQPQFSPLVQQSQLSPLVQQPQFLQAGQVPSLIQARPLYHPTPHPQHILIQSLPATPQHIQMAPSPQILAVAPSAQAMLLSNPPVASPGTMYIATQGVL